MDKMTGQFKEAESKDYGLESMIYEMDEGTPIYYRGYRQVLNGAKSPEQIMGSSILRSLVIKLIQEFLDRQLGQTHKALSNEIGIQYKKQSWRNVDIAVYSMKELSRNRRKIADKYASFPPDMVFEIDTKADLEPDKNLVAYAFRKTQQLLDFGVQLVVWIFTADEKFIIARPGQRWEIGNWNENIEIQSGLMLNISSLIADFEKQLDKQ